MTTSTLSKDNLGPARLRRMPSPRPNIIFNPNTGSVLLRSHDCDARIRSRPSARIFTLHSDFLVEA